ncbi:MAG: plasmid stabilization protein [Bacteroidetes bacterium RIFOXYA12_FULL_35_11]|nr:MAG: plasmid stabilization protein [Bacteroidetes bacterium GWF2_35_48]OFY73734.1 MAG: plasmid stabilization protein [Bacteroidetes bacterium RIFOXYA12_FULL_35_11]OFZ01985.1 MAG: plasmid stabilization protein [Bacteroidetes bacterium RIFOXYC12_FULL_35_7]HBX53100.1 plasmid stabilization protein [Bacteroidales bacterium]
MEVKYTSLFNKDISGIRNNKLVQSIEDAIDNAKQAVAVTEIKNLRKLKTYKNHYRIRIGDYRIGLFIENNTIEFARFLHRKDIYKYFP